MIWLGIVKNFFVGVLEDEFGRLFVGFESEFFGDETETNGWIVSSNNVSYVNGSCQSKAFDSRFAYVGQRAESFSFDKHVHEVGAHVRWVEI